MAIQSQPSRISEPFAGSGTKNTIPATNATPSASQAASWASGFPPECSQPISAGGCPVPRNDVNGVLNQLSQDYAFRQDGGVWAWSALADYDVARIVMGSDGTVYKAVAQSGPSTVAGSQDPTADVAGSYWVMMPSKADVVSYVNNQGYALDSDVVHNTGNESISGSKVFDETVVVSNTYPLYKVRNEDADKRYIPASGTRPGWEFAVQDKNNRYAFATIYTLNNDNNDGHSIMDFVVFRNYDSEEYRSIVFDYYTSGASNFRPSTNANINLGSPNKKWNNIYANNGTIQTSDIRAKDDISNINDEVLDAWGEVNFVQFRLKDAVQKKNNKARFHSGLIAQNIQSVFDSRGLDVSKYGFFCHDEWPFQPEEPIGSTGAVRPETPAGDAFSLRYEEALCVEAAFQRRRADRAEARLAALEERVAAIEAKLNAQP